MSSISKLPPWWKDGPHRRRVEIDLSSPALAVAALERLLTGTGTSSHADEVWWAVPLHACTVQVLIPTSPLSQWCWVT